MHVSWTVAGAVLDNICRRFERTYCLHLYGYAVEEFSVEKEAMIKLVLITNLMHNSFIL
jgi:hypothetical protein